MPADVAVLVVSYETAATTLECLAALRHSVGVELRPLVYDNGSHDGSAVVIAECEPGVELVAGDSNVGFGRANNALYERTKEPFVLLLNSDCMVEPRTIADCLSFLKERPAASAVACQLRGVTGGVQRSCRAFPTILGEVARVLFPFQVLQHIPGLGAYYMGGWAHDCTRIVDQPAGAFLLMRRGAWGDGPPFDDRFFMYYEDVDLCRRLKSYGPVWFFAGARATHLGEHSSARVRSAMASALAVSRHQYFEKWHGAWAASLVSATGVLASLVRWLTWRIASLLRDHSQAEDRALAHWSAAESALRMVRRD